MMQAALWVVTDGLSSHFGGTVYGINMYFNTGAGPLINSNSISSRTLKVCSD